MNFSQAETQHHWKLRIAKSKKIEMFKAEKDIHVDRWDYPDI